MPYPKVEPISIDVMLKKRYHGHNSICEKLREIYMMTDNEDIKLRTRICMAMSKKMHERLKWYKAKNLAEAETMEKKDASTEL